MRDLGKEIGCCGHLSPGTRRRCFPGARERLRGDMVTTLFAATHSNPAIKPPGNAELCLRDT